MTTYTPLDKKRQPVHFLNADKDIHCNSIHVDSQINFDFPGQVVGNIDFTGNVNFTNTPTMPSTPSPTLATVLGAGNSATGLKITNLGVPFLGTDAANKNYVDGAVSIGLSAVGLPQVVAYDNSANNHSIIGLNSVDGQAGVLTINNSGSKLSFFGDKLYWIPFSVTTTNSTPVSIWSITPPNVDACYMVTVNCACEADNASPQQTKTIRRSSRFRVVAGGSPTTTYMGNLESLSNGDASLAANAINMSTGSPVSTKIQVEVQGGPAVNTTRWRGYIEVVICTAT